MKKIFAILLAVMMLASMATVASAASTTTLTTTVPAATYTLNIPADQEIPFGTTETNIGNVTITNSSGFAVGKNVQVTVNYDAFKCEGVSTTIPFTLKVWNEEAWHGNQKNRVSLPSGGILTFYGKSDTTVGEYAKETFEFASSGNSHMRLDVIDKITMHITSADWGKALGGEYTATITFTAEVVAEQ